MMNRLPSSEGRLLIPYLLGPHDGDFFRANPSSEVPARIARSHGAGTQHYRSIYALTECECHGLHFLYLSEEPLP